MKTLALETSAKSVSVAVTEDSRVLASSYQNIGLTHSVTLMPLLEAAKRGAGSFRHGSFSRGGRAGQLYRPAHRRFGSEGPGLGRG